MAPASSFPRDSPQPPWWLRPDLPPRLYAEAVLREHAARITADLMDEDETSRIGSEVMTATEPTTPDKSPHSSSWNLDVDVMAASETLTPER